MRLAMQSPSIAITAEDAKAAFELLGKPIGHWADEHGFPRADVYAVINGRTVGKRGRAHQIAVALGIKGTSADSRQAAIAIAAARIQEGAMK